MTNEVQSTDANEVSVTNPMQLMQIAVQGGADIDKLERLMSLQERWEKKEAAKAFNAAFSQWQEAKPVIAKTKKVAFKETKYFYAPLSSIQKEVDPILSKYGLSYSWKQESNNGVLRVTCVLKHELGHSEETWLESNKDDSGKKNQIQSIGSAVTYLKRYTLQNIIGLTADDDDDGKSTGLTTDEVNDMKRTKIIALMNDVENQLTENTRQRIEEVLSKNEFSSYGKIITHLESFKL